MSRQQLPEALKAAGLRWLREGKMVNADQRGHKIAWSQTTPADQGYAPNCVLISEAGVYYNSGTITTATWTLLAAAGVTLQTAFAAGGTITGATAAAKMTVGDGTDALTFYATNASNMAFIGVAGGADITIIPNATVNVTGILDVSGALNAGTANAFTVSAAGAIVGVGLNYGAGALSGTGDVTINTTAFTVTAATGACSIGGALTVASIVCAGNITGTFIGTWGGSTWNANPTITLSATTGTGLLIDGDTITSGDLLRLEGDASMSGGYFLRCINVAAPKFSIGSDGATIIAGTLAGSDALTVSAGDVKVTAGNIIVTLGNCTLTDGNYIITEGKLTIDTATNEGNKFARNQAVTTVPILEIEATNVDDDYPCLYLDAKQTGAVDAMQIVYAGTASGLDVTAVAATGTALRIQGAANGTDSLVKVDGTTTDWIGATWVGMVNLTCDGALAHANASLLNITYSGTGAASGLGTSLRIVDTGATNTSHAVYLSAGTGSVLYIAGGGTVDTITTTSAAAAASFLKVTMSAATGTALEIISAASATVSQLSFTNAGTGATGWLGAANVGMVSIVGDGNLAHANASMLYIAYSGTGAATGLGTCIRIVDTGATTTSNAVYVSSAAGGALLIAGAGAVDTITVTSAAAAASALKITCSAATGTAIEQISAASATTALQTLTNGGSAATGWLGATGVGMLTITNDGNLAHANASCLLIAYSGTGAATGLGTSLRITDTGSTATAYAVYISAGTGEAFFVDTGKAKFTEAATFKAANRNYSVPNYVAADASNDMAIALTDADGTAVTLAAGLELYINMGAFTLQAAGNTITLNGAGGAKSIKKGSAPTVDKAVIAAANSIVHVVYNGTAWLDMSE